MHKEFTEHGENDIRKCISEQQKKENVSIVYN